MVRCAFAAGQLYDNAIRYGNSEKRALEGVGRKVLYDLKNAFWCDIISALVLKRNRMLIVVVEMCQLHLVVQFVR